MFNYVIMYVVFCYHIPGEIKLCDTRRQSAKSNNSKYPHRFWRGSTLTAACLFAFVCVC